VAISDFQPTRFINQEHRIWIPQTRPNLSILSPVLDNIHSGTLAYSTAVPQAAESNPKAAQSRTPVSNGRI